MSRIPIVVQKPPPAFGHSKVDRESVQNAVRGERSSRGVFGASAVADPPKISHRASIPGRTKRALKEQMTVSLHTTGGMYRVEK
jgi:hypothetical protein